MDSGNLLDAQDPRRVRLLQSIDFHGFCEQCCYLLYQIGSIPSHLLRRILGYRHSSSSSKWYGFIGRFLSARTSSGVWELCNWRYNWSTICRRSGCQQVLIEANFAPIQMWDTAHKSTFSRKSINVSPKGSWYSVHATGTTTLTASSNARVITITDVPNPRQCYMGFTIFMSQTIRRNTKTGQGRLDV